MTTDSTAGKKRKGGRLSYFMLSIAVVWAGVICMNLLTGEAGGGGRYRGRENRHTINRREYALYLIFPMALAGVGFLVKAVEQGSTKPNINEQK